ncbi:Serine hydroxymethyltransferase [hydrothermal vent metagenome]|uniref:Serine hydroxymethyltransferase n=1 Tax=hydrothermal vent metagenome TaxID=652676 RepID=A0A3B1DTE8_9ZZZZ
MSHDPIAESVLAFLREQDPEAGAILAAEAGRQATTLELIASENHASPAVMHAMGTCLTNKYAEGYPGARYYGGCEHHDAAENLARERAKALFGCAFANVQPHSGAQANAAVFLAMLKPGDTFASLKLSDGGHLSHGLKVNMSGKWFNPVHYPLHYDEGHERFEQIDYDAVEEVCREHKPKILMCGYSAYPRVIDFAKFREIADTCGALLMADIAHIAGLVAAGVHPSPFPHCDIVTTTTHKTLRGPRGGLIMTNDAELAKKVDRAVFPGMQGGPLMHVVFAKAIAFGEALKPEFRAYQERVVQNAKALAGGLAARGYRITSGGTDNHVMLVDLRTRDAELTGADAERWLEQAGIITNKNGVPQDPRPPRVTSGLRLGTPAVTTQGLGEAEMAVVAELIDRVLGGKGDEGVCAQTREEVTQMCGRFPLP